MDKRDRFPEGFNPREVLLLMSLESLPVTVVGLEFTIVIDKEFLFANAPNGNISLQHEMQKQRSFDP